MDKPSRMLYILARLCMATIFIVAGLRKALGYAGLARFSWVAFLRDGPRFSWR